MRRVLTVLFVGGSLLLPLTAAAAPSVHPAVEQQSQTPNNIIRGKVVDKEGSPLLGVSIQIVGTSRGAVTKGDGTFELTTKNAQERLHVTYIGMRSKDLTAKAGTTINITLEDDNKILNDVVVTGIVKKNKQSYTGAQTTVKSEQLLSVGTKNVLQSLEAFVPGLVIATDNLAGSDPNRLPDLSLRGRASFEGKANLPLFVVDGAQVDVNYIYDMDINTIESFTVLKDASATALYGAKAAAGVIVIVTKAPPQGALRLSYSGTARFSMPDLSDYHLLNGAQKLEYERLAGRYTEANLASQWAKDQQYDEIYKIVRSGFSTDWLSKPLRTGVSHTHSITADGGTESARYGITLRYGSDEGVMKGSKRERISGSFKLTYNKPRQYFLSNSFTVNIANGQNSPYGSFGSYVARNPYENPYDEQGTLKSKLSYAGSSISNPLYEASLGSFSRSGNTSILNVTSGEYWFGDLRVSGDFTFNYNLDTSRAFVSPLAKSEQEKTTISERGTLSESFSKRLGYSGKLVFSYNKTFWEKLYMTSSAGTTIEGQTDDNSGYTSRGYYSDELRHPGFALGYAPSARPSGSLNRATNVGFFLNPNFSYDNRYFVDFTYRYEGSSKFGANNRFAPFWSFGAGWNLHNESFVRGKLGKIELMKLRASIGQQGNLNFDPYQAITTYTYANGIDYITAPGAVPRDMGNPNLTWERQLQLNAGLDLTLFKNRWDLSVDVYRKYTDDLLLDVTQAPSIGYTTAKQNLGALINTGVEFQTRVTPVQNKDWRWMLSLTYSYNKNKISKISDALKKRNDELGKSQIYTEVGKLPNETQAEYNARQNAERDAATAARLRPIPQYVEGQSMTALQVVPSAGIDPATGREIYIKRDGSYTFTYDPNDRVNFGDQTPWAYGSLVSYLYYKQFSLTANFGYSLGAVTYNSTLAQRVEGTTYENNADERVFTDRWKKPGDVSQFRSIALRDVPYQSSRFVSTENYFTLKSLSVAYEVNGGWVRKLGAKTARFELLTNDLFYLSSIKRERGLDYPFARSIEFTIRATF